MGILDEAQTDLIDDDEWEFDIPAKDEFADRDEEDDNM